MTQETPDWYRAVQMDLFPDAPSQEVQQLLKDLEKKSPLDRQVGGSHYKDSTVQPITFIQANDLSFCEGNAVKYIARHRLKGGRQDLEKAIHYLQLEIEFTYGHQ